MQIMLQIGFGPTHYALTKLGYQQGQLIRFWFRVNEELVEVKVKVLGCPRDTLPPDFDAYELEVEVDEVICPADSTTEHWLAYQNLGLVQGAKWALHYWTHNNIGIAQLSK